MQYLNKTFSVQQPGKIFGCAKCVYGRGEHTHCEGFYGPCPEVGKLRVCRTAYANETLNHSPILCDLCAEAYNDHWDEMWENVRG